MILNKFKDKKVLILGFGREGIDTFKFLRKLFPKKILGIGDKLKASGFQFPGSGLIKKDKKVRLHLGKDYLKAIKNYDVVVKSPGIAPRIIKPFITKKQRLTSQTEIFLRNCPGKIIGITGTKGKSTTATLTYKILKVGKIKAHLIGNIGKPVLSFLLKAKLVDVFVYELSSHQLMNLKVSPHIAVFLNIFPEHLDYYKDFSQYFKAKQNICRYQRRTDFFIYNPEDKKIAKLAKITKAKKIPFNVRGVKKIIKLNKTNLEGEFNLINMAASIEVGKIFSIPKRIIKKAIKEFKGLPHRLEFVGKFKGIRFYNDALATIPEATILAIETLGKDVQTILLGGSERYQNFKALAKKILENKIKNLILFPTTRDRIMEEILKNAKKLKIKTLPNCFFVNNMKDATELSFKHTKKGKICLLSTASPSFSIFKDYKEKGNLFKKYVKKLAKK